MAESNPAPPSSGGAAPAATGAESAASTYKKAPPGGNPVLRMMGLPNLPKKLPSRNWLIFWGLTASFTGAVVYDKREKRRATALWTRAVSHLAKEPIAHPNQLPRKLTIYLESPPAEGLRVAQDHYTEYMKPILAASGLDWEFVQGRMQGDIRAAAAEKIRRLRREADGPAPEPVDGRVLTDEEIVKGMRQRTGTPAWTGANGDIVVGRHTWKEYVRGLHEGWLGPLDAPAAPEPEAKNPFEDEDKDKKADETPDPEAKPARPPQIPPYNTTDDYPNSHLPSSIPSEFALSAPVTIPHILGFRNTFVRLGRFLNRRRLADDIGREVAAVCLAASREYHQGASPTEAEQLTALEREERDWPQSVWNDEEKNKEKVWANPIVLDPRISMRMRRFELRPEDEERAREIKVPEEEVEGWIKGSFRSLYRWAVSEPPRPYSSDDI